MYADAYLGLSTIASGKPGDGHVYLRRAVGRARELGDEAAYLRVSAYAMAYLSSLSDQDLVERLSEEFLRRPHAVGRPADLAVGLAAAGRRLFGRGEREAAEHAWRELNQLAEQTHDPIAIAHAASARSLGAFLDGHLDQAASLGQTAMTLANAMAVFTGQRGPRLLLPQVLLYLGRASELSGTEVPSSRPGRAGRAERALFVSWLGHCEEALEIRGGFANIGDSDDRTAPWILAAARGGHSVRRRGNGRSARRSAGSARKQATGHVFHHQLRPAAG